MLAGRGIRRRWSGAADGGVVGFNALADITNELYKAECVYGPDSRGGWVDVDQLKLDTTTWVHSHCDNVPPAEFEAALYTVEESAPNRD